MKKALCFKQGSFSFVNESIARTLPLALPGYEYRWLDIIDDIARRRPATYLAGLIEATLRYPQPIFRYRFSPQAFLPRTVVFLRMFEHWVPPALSSRTRHFRFKRSRSSVPFARVSRISATPITRIWRMHATARLGNFSR